MTLRNADFFINQYYIHHRRLLTIIGLWPYQDSSKRIHYVSFISVLVALGIIIQIYLLLCSEWKLIPTIELLQNFLPNLCFTTSYYDFLYNFATFKKMLDHIAYDWNKLTTDAELTMMKKYASVSNLCCVMIACVYYFYVGVLVFPSMSCLFMYIFGAIEDTQLILPIHNKAFIANKMHYFFMFSLELIIIMMVCTIGITSCGILILNAQHVYALFNIVTIKIDQPFSKNALKFNWPSSEEDELEWIIDVIKSYHDALNFFELLKSFYRRIYLLQVFLVFFVIILDFIYLFQVLDGLITMSQMLSNCDYILGNLLMIYSIFFLGQRLIDHNSNVCTKCCIIPFYVLSTKTNKLLLLLIMRCMKPCQFSIGGIIVASHELIKTITKTSFSFAAVFRSTR